MRGYEEDGTTTTPFDMTVLNDMDRSGVLQVASEIIGVALRIVAPGTFFQKHARIDDAYYKELEGAAHLAPLHAGPALKEAEHLQRLFPREIRLSFSSMFEQAFKNIDDILGKVSGCFSELENTEQTPSQFMLVKSTIGRLAWKEDGR